MTISPADLDRMEALAKAAIATSDCDDLIEGMVPIEYNVLELVRLARRGVEAEAILAQARAYISPRGELSSTPLAARIDAFLAAGGRG